MYKALRPLLFALPPEAAHAAASVAMRLARSALPLLKPWLVKADPRLERIVWGLRFPNPVGLAAGFDKYARHVQDWPHLGFGFAEIGSITALPQPGNPRPRVWRYAREQALINRFGFNNLGADATAQRLRTLKDSGCWPSAPLGVNLGKSKLTAIENATSDYVASMQALRDYADYFAINVSSPNTLGLRSLQSVKAIRGLIRDLRKECKRGRKALPLLVKFAPDLSRRDLLAACDAALGAGADGLILCNTTLSRDALEAGQHPEGGLSGRPLRVMADACLVAVAKHTRGRVPLVGVGGVFSAADARRKLDLGATLIQVYTGYVYEGPALPRLICEALVSDVV